MQTSRLWKSESRLPFLTFWLSTNHRAYITVTRQVSRYYCGMQTKWLVAGGELSIRTKVAKERILALVATTNIDGSDKPQLMVVGKSAKQEDSWGIWIVFQSTMNPHSRHG